MPDRQQKDIQQKTCTCDVNPPAKEKRLWSKRSRMSTRRTVIVLIVIADSMLQGRGHGEVEARVVLSYSRLRMNEIQVPQSLLRPRFLKPMHLGSRLQKPRPSRSRRLPIRKLPMRSPRLPRCLRLMNMGRQASACCILFAQAH